MLLYKNVKDCPEFKAGDLSMLREVLHPMNDHVDVPYSLAFANLEAGMATLPHKLESSEVYYFLRGNGQAFIDGNKIILKEGSVLYVSPQTEQYIENTGSESLEFLCIVEPYWTSESEEILKIDNTVN